MSEKDFVSLSPETTELFLRTLLTMLLVMLV
jgi:hypothetical protein